MENGFLLSVGRFYGDVHFGQHTTSDREIYVYIRFCWWIPKIYLCKMAIFLFGQIERELIIHG